MAFSQYFQKVGFMPVKPRPSLRLPSSGPQLPRTRENDFKPTSVSLTCKGMMHVNWDLNDSEFEFVFGNKVCCIPYVLSEYLSPKVARIRRCDPLCYSYTFQDSEVFDALESLVSNLRSGQALRVEKSNFPALLRLAHELENGELLSSLIGTSDIKSLSLEKAILLLRAGIDLGTAFSSQFENLRDFVASHFHALGKQILDELDLETLQLLLSSPSLQIKDEDSLYDFVRSRSEDDSRFTSLFEFICFDYLSVDRIENFAFFVNENLLEGINSAIWRSICRRLILEVKPKRNPRAVCKEFICNGSNSLNGIISYLSDKCGGNVHDQGIVNVTASSFIDVRVPKHAVEIRSDSEFCSSDEENSWICYDFKDRRVIPTSYTVRSYGAAPDWDHPKSWVIEASNDGSSWEQIDRRVNKGVLNTPHVTVNFKISSVPGEMLRFLRFRLTGVTHRGCHFLTFCALEFFGSLFEK